MTKRTRLIILLFCVICFFVIAPILVAYSEGYRFDFEKMKIVATGGIYVRTFPAAGQIIIDSKLSEKPGLFASSIFVQSLLPKEHTISIKKDGYSDYFKTLPVQENRVTKLENVLLIKNNIKFDALLTTGQTAQLSPFDKLEKYIIKNNNLYYSNAPENKTISVDQKLIPIIKNLVAFKITNNNILWLSSDGILYQSNSLVIQDVLKNSNFKPLNISPIEMSKKGTYKIIADGQNIFLNNNGQLDFFDSSVDNFKNIASSITDAVISPDSNNIVYSSKGKIFLYTISPDANRNFLEPKKTTILFDSKDVVTDFFWINNDYIILASGDKIIISEIDFRGNINIVTLSQTVLVAITTPSTLKTESATVQTKIDIKNPKIYFDQSSQKLYILTGKNLLLSEKITP